MQSRAKAEVRYALTPHRELFSLSEEKKSYSDTCPSSVPQFRTPIAPTNLPIPSVVDITAPPALRSAFETSLTETHQEVVEPSTSLVQNTSTGRMTLCCCALPKHQSSLGGGCALVGLLPPFCPFLGEWMVKNEAGRDEWDYSVTPTLQHAWNGTSIIRSRRRPFIHRRIQQRPEYLAGGMCKFEPYFGDKKGGDWDAERGY
jgi:hypothetical protein